MSWQDAVITIGQFLMVLFLLPTLVGTQKPNLWTSLGTSIILYVFGCTFTTLYLIASAASSFLAGVVWMVLFVQALGQGHDVLRT